MANENRTVDVVARHGDYSVERVTITSGPEDAEPYYFVDVFGPGPDLQRTCTNIYQGTDRKIAEYISRRLAMMCHRLHRGHQ